MGSFYGRRGIGLASVLALAVAILGVNLGLWQLRRAEEKASLQQAQDRAAAAILTWIILLWRSRAIDVEEGAGHGR